ncbi:MAG: hypothetical protein JJU18_09770 [Oceanicaulis sp.]|nr:hypothetical protein [Oceanicaulis sp.]
MSAIWLLPLAVGLPLVLAGLSALPGIRDRSLTLAVIAPAPGLAAALFAPRDDVLVLPDLVLGVSLSLSEPGALFLGGASLLWLVAGLYSRFSMRGKDRAGNFALFWNLCLAGNLGVFLAADAITFYVAFALVSLMAFPLVIHDRSQKALNAGVAYIALAVLGEAALLAGLILASGAAGGVADLKAIVDAIGLSPDRSLILVLLIIGFGVKAGLAPLHVWLPVAHPAAPVPASAVLSGAIVKTGIFGLLTFLPFGDGHMAAGAVLGALGFAGAFGAAIYGLTQDDPKAVLAYSTVSQMGLMLAGAGAGLAAGLDASVLMAVIAIYALHHGLAKGALFLGAGAMAETSGRPALRLRAVLGVVALSVAGLPLTGGALAKLALKAPLGPASALLITVSAFTTALLLAHFLAVVRPSGAAHAPAPRVRSVPVMLLGAGALILPWAVWAMSGLPAGYAWRWDNLAAGAAPLALAVLVAALAHRARLSAPRAPQGDLLVPAMVMLSAMGSSLQRAIAQAEKTLPRLLEVHVSKRVLRLGDLADRTEAALPAVLPALLLALILLIAALALA